MEMVAAAKTTGRLQSGNHCESCRCPIRFGGMTMNNPKSLYIDSKGRMRWHCNDLLADQLLFVKLDKRRCEKARRRRVS